MATLINDQQMASLVMHCPNEDTTYPEPLSMINKETGKVKYAYVTLVMLNEAYVAGAIVLAHSIRKCGSKADIVVLITPDISENSRKILGMYFTHVIEVPYIEIKNFRTVKQPQRRYLDLVFTKFNLFNLTQYEKVLLIDADALVLKHGDHLFTLNSPAGCLIDDKSLVITYDKEGNYVMPKNGKIEWYEKYCDKIPHGTIIPKEHTDKLKTHPFVSSIGGGLMLLTPKKGELENIINFTKYGFMREKNYPYKLIFPEQGTLALYYSGRWTSINPVFFGLQSYPRWEILFALQYGGDKPFVLKSKADIKVRIQYPDFVLWHEYYSEMLKANPELAVSPSMVEANEMNKFFDKPVRQLERTQKNNNAQNENQVQVISKIFEINEKRIHPNHLNYYYINRDIGYQQFKMPVMFDNIKPNDYLEPILRLSKYFDKSNYYEELLKKYPTMDITRITDQIDKDLVMLEYVKCKSNMFVLTLWPLTVDNSDCSKITKLLEKYGTICHTKKITINRNGLFNLMFWMYDEFTYQHRIDFITKKMDYVGATDSNNVMFVFLENTTGSKIAGQGSLAKKEIRNTLEQMLDLPNKKEIRGNDLIHINDHFYQAIAYAQLILNANSLDVLSEQNIANIVSPSLITANLKLQTFKKWLTQNMSLLEQNRLIIMGSVVLYAYGYKKSNDIDAVYISCGTDSDKSTSEQDMADRLNKNFGIKKTKIPFADIGVENSKHWRESWTIKNNEILNYFKIKNFTELTTNPRYHFYFEGFKCYLLTHEIIRKICRNRNNDHADFVILSALYPEKFSQYVKISEGKLVYQVNVGQTGPELEYDYMMELGNMILNRYTRWDLDKFEKIMVK